MLYEVITTDLQHELQRSVRYNSVFSVILFDIDWFKQINDTHGHPAGDSVLRELAQLLRANLRVTEIPCRWGGEEFLILCVITSYSIHYTKLYDVSAIMLGSVQVFIHTRDQLIDFFSARELRNTDADRNASYNFV